jgi:hypothetical protein
VAKSRLTLIFFGAIVAAFLFALTSPLYADNVSYTGTLGEGQAGDVCSNPSDAATCVYELTFTLSSMTNVTLQTWSFGGGTNAAGTHIAAGGVAPLVGFWQGMGPTATLLLDPSDPSGLGGLASAWNQSNYGSYSGCPQGHNVALSNGDTVCGDLRFNLALGAGTYTITLSDPSYQPADGVNPGLNPVLLGDGFAAAFGADAFDLQDYNPANNKQVDGLTTQDWAFDLNGPVATPEPTTLLLLASGVGLCYRRGFRRRSRR